MMVGKANLQQEYNHITNQDNFFKTGVLMKSYIRYYLAILLLVACSDIYSQIRTIVGFNLTSVELNIAGTDVESQGATGIHYGIIFSMQVNDNFAIQPGIMFTSKGSSYQIDTVDISISPIYIEVPVNLSLNFGTDAVGVTIFTGSYVSYGIGGTKIESGGEAKEIAFGKDESNDLKHFDIGLNLGAGINIKGWLISAQYGLGLANLSPVTSPSTEMNNRVIGISVTTKFAGR